MSSLSLSKQSNDLVQKILYTILLLLIFRVGSFIPIPCINTAAMLELSSKNEGGFLGMFNMLSGGALGRMSIFALAIMPYITASIMIQLFSMLYPPLENLRKEGETGRKQLNQLSRYLTIFLAIIESYIVAINLESASIISENMVFTSNLFFKISTICTLVSGTMLLVWIGEQISCRGIGNGSSMIIFVGIITGIPSSVISLLELARTGSISYLKVFIVLISTLLSLAFVVYIEKSFRKVLVQTPHKKSVNGQGSYLPIKINIAGVIPPMFAGSVLFLPVTLAGFFSNNGPVAESIIYYFSRGKPLFLLFYALLIIFFSFFYSAIVFNSEEVANNLKKAGAFIPGKRPGSATAEYFDYLVTRITVLGAIYLIFICFFSELLLNKVSSFALSGTSLLICVSVVMDTFTQIQSHNMSKQYGALVKKIRFR